MRKINSATDADKLAKAIVLSARIASEHFRFSKNHNFDMANALIDAAAGVGITDVDRESLFRKRAKNEPKQ